MFRSLRHRGYALLALLLLALGAVGHAHRAPSAVEAALLAYLPLGVTIDDICGMPGMGSGEDCPLCRVDPGYLPQVPSQGRGLALSFATLVVVRPATAAPSAYPIRPGQGPRAPPFA